MFEYSKKLVVRKAVKGEDALLIADGVDYSIKPESVDFEPMLARDISENDEDFILKGKVVDKMFIATDVVYHGEYMANKSWSERFLDLKKGFDYTPSVRWSGAIVVEDGSEIEDAVKAFSCSPYFDGVYIEDYSSDMFESRGFINEDLARVID